MATEKPRVRIQTLAEFEQDLRQSKEFLAVKNERLKQDLKDNVSNLQAKLIQAKEELKNFKPEVSDLTTYEDWVRRVRENKEQGYEVIENDDSKKVQ